MLFSTKNSVKASVNSSSKTASIKKKETFWAFIVRKCRQALMSLWMYSRKFLWVSSTALIIAFLPFAFAYFMELQSEMMKMNAMQGRYNQM